MQWSTTVQFNDNVLMIPPLLRRRTCGRGFFVHHYESTQRYCFLSSRRSRIVPIAKGCTLKAFECIMVVKVPYNTLSSRNPGFECFWATIFHWTVDWVFVWYTVRIGRWQSIRRSHVKQRCVTLHERGRCKNCQKYLAWKRGCAELRPPMQVIRHEFQNPMSRWRQNNSFCFTSKVNYIQQSRRIYLIKNIQIAVATSYGRPSNSCDPQGSIPSIHRKSSL